MLPVFSRDLPLPGQLVDLRHRRYVVLDVGRSALSPSLLQTSSPAFSGAAQILSGPHHLVSLASVEDDGQGDTLEVVWEREAGAKVLERPAMPRPGLADPDAPFDSLQRFDAFMDAVRWNAISSADISALQAPFRSGVEIEDYQLDPVARSLQMARTSLLIADDVGLGKTIEAGLVAQELLLRGRARTVLVVCPADIQLQWQSEMREKFGLEFRIIDAEGMRALRRRRGLNINPWTHFPRLITSMDFLKRERPLSLFRETLPKEGEARFPRRYGLLVVDEAHNVAPSGSGHYALDSNRTRAIREIAAHFEHKVFLSATPHNGFKESFSALLELLDNARFARGVEPSREMLAQVLVRRLKSELPPGFDGKPRFPGRKLEAIEVQFSDDERALHTLLTRYSRTRSEGTRSESESLATQFVLKLLKKRLFSSPQAFFDTLQTHRATLEHGKSSAPSVARETSPLRREIEALEEPFGDDLERDAQIEETTGQTTRFFRELSAEERALLSQMSDIAGALCARGEAKSAALISWLRDTLKPGGKWNGERAILFTEYRATQKWLFELLVAAGLGEGGRLELIYGGMDGAARERIKAAFQTHPDESSVRILLATDAASEGVNLQNHCSRLVHYEIPWNPNRLEQRNGRIDRHGQKAREVEVFHFVGAGYKTQNASEKVPGDLEGDLEFLLRAARKVEQIREDLGKVGPVIAAQVEEAMLGKRRALSTQGAEAEASPVRRMLRFERDLKKELSRLSDELRASRDDLQITPQNVERAVRVALELAGQPPLVEAGLPGVRAFELGQLRGSWASALLGLSHPFSGARRPVSFDSDAVRGRDDVVNAHLGHRLVQLSLGLLRAQIWAYSEEGALLRRGKINRVCARLLRGGRFEHPVVIAHGRLVVLGGEQNRLHEEIIVAGGILREGRFARLNVGQVREVLDLQTDGAAPDNVCERLAAMWPSIEEPLLRSLEARVEDRSAGLEKFLLERAETEANHARTVLQELQSAIERELSDDGPLQLELWSDAESDQLKRNREALRRRLNEIPGDIERETNAILERFLSPSPRLFPAAITFLVPSSVR